MKAKPEVETSNQSNQFEKFKEFARKIVNVPKKEIDEQEKIYQMNKKPKAK